MNVYILSLIITSILSLTLTIYLWLKRQSRMGRLLFLMTGAVSLWAFIYALEIAADTEASMLFLIKIQYIPIVSVPLLWMFFSLEFSGWIDRLNPNYRYIFFLVPAIVVLSVWTNDWHDLYYSSTAVVDYGGTQYLDIEYGPVYWLNTVYAYVLTLSGSGLMIFSAVKSQDKKLGSAAVLVIGSVIPVLTHAVSILGWVPNPYFDLTPIGLAIAMIMLAVGLFQFKILHLIPLAQNLLFSRWKDAFIVLNPDGEVVDFNPAAAELPFFLQDPIRIGKKLTSIQPVFAFINQPENSTQSLHEPEWRFQKGQQLRIFDIQVWSIEIDEEGSLGWMLGIRDVSQMVRSHEKLAKRERILRCVHEAEVGILNTMDLDAGIETFLKELGVESGINRVYLYRHSFTPALEDAFKKTAEWMRVEPLEITSPPIFQMLEQGLEEVSVWPALTAQGEMSIFDSARLDGDAREIFNRSGVTSSVTIPVMVEGTLWGVLGFDSFDDVKYFEQDDTEVLISAGNAVGAALNRTQIYNEMDHKAEFLSFLSQLSQEGNREQPAEELRKKLSEVMKEFSGADNVLILPKSQIESVGLLNIPPEILELYQRLEGANLPVSLTPADDEFPEGFSDFKAVIGFPVVSSGEFLGVVVLFFIDFKALQSEEIEEYLQIISQIGLILAKSKSIDSLEAQVSLRTQAYEEANLALEAEMREKDTIAQNLLENEKLYQSLFEKSSDPIFILDLKGSHVSVNNKAAELLGYSVEELTALTRFDIVQGEELGQSSIIFDGLMEGKEFPPFSRTFLHKDGSHIPMEINVSLIYAQDGSPKYIQSVARDVTARQARESRIELQFKRLSSLRKIDRMVSTNLDLYLTLDILVREVIDQMEVDAADVLLLKESGKLEFESGYGFEHTSIHQTQIELGEGTLGKAAQNRQMLRYVRSELAADFEFERFTQNSDEGFISYFAFPLEVQGQVQGVLEVFHREALNPTEDWLDFLETMAAQAAIAIDNSYLFTDLAKTNKELEQAYVSTLEGWARALDLRDNETAGHTERVTEMTVSLGSLMGLNPTQLVDLKRGAILHDIGKMGVPDAVLLKPGKLDPEERKIMEQHPQYAYDMLSQIDFLISSLDIPYGHHEKWDGTGYPRGLKEEEIPLAARIFCIVDVWDALTSDRPYRKAWTDQKTFDYIRELSGSHFDPDVVKSFFELLEYTTDAAVDWESFHEGAVN